MSGNYPATQSGSERIYMNLNGIKDLESGKEMMKSGLIMLKRSLNGVTKKAKEFLSLNNLGGN